LSQLGENHYKIQKEGQPRGKKKIVNVIHLKKLNVASRHEDVSGLEGVNVIGGVFD